MLDFPRFSFDSRFGFVIIQIMTIIDFLNLLGKAAAASELSRVVVSVNEIRFRNSFKSFSVAHRQSEVIKQA